MIGERLKEVRQDHGHTQSDLARKMNVSLSTIKSWEGENSAPKHEYLIAICKLYHVSSDFLLGLTDDDPVFSKMRRDKLNDRNRSLLNLFEEFLLYKQQKESKE